MVKRENKAISMRFDEKKFKRLEERLSGTGVSRAEFMDIILGMTLDNADMYEEIDFPVNDKRQVYTGDKLIMETGGAVEPGQFLYGLSCLTKARGEK